jgi:hypothetical protein
MSDRYKDSREFLESQFGMSLEKLHPDKQPNAYEIMRKIAGLQSDLKSAQEARDALQLGMERVALWGDRIAKNIANAILNPPEPVPSPYSATVGEIVELADAALNPKQLPDGNADQVPLGSKSSGLPENHPESQGGSQKEVYCQVHRAYAPATKQGECSWCFIRNLKPAPPEAPEEK